MSTFHLVKQIPQINKSVYSIYHAYDQKGRIYYAKIFSISRLQQYGLDEALQYNEQVLSDMQGIAFPQNINKILVSIPNDGFFTFISQPYQTNLEQYMHRNCINQQEALRIFDNVLKAIYSVYSNGYWHKNIRAEHFVKVGSVWKLDSLVYNQDMSKENFIQSEYFYDSAYQPPEAYENNLSKFNDEDFFPVVVWNLGSLLLDLFFSVHKLKNFQILQSFKGKKFSLQDIKVKKTDIFSKKIKQILSRMLHYDPKQRMRLQDVFSNEYLSKQVARAFKKKHKYSITSAMKIFTGGRSVLSSALRSKQQRDMGNQILPISQLMKTTISNIGKDVKKSTLSQQKNLTEVQTQQSFFDRVNIFSQFFKQSSKDEKTKQLNNFEDLMSNQQLRQIIKVYKSYSDKSDLLSITGNKLQQIDYKDNKKQIILLSKYALEVASYINLQKLIGDLDKNTQQKNFDKQLHKKFTNSAQKKAIQKILEQKRMKKQQTIKQIKQLLQSLANSQKKLLQQPQTKRFLSIQLSKAQFLQIKSVYRKILKISYDLITKKFNNQSSSNEKLARLAMYVVYSLTIDKLYIESMIEKNFEPYFQWSRQKPSGYIPLDNFQKYIQQANVKTLILHAKSILERYFKL